MPDFESTSQKDDLLVWRSYVKIIIWPLLFAISIGQLHTNEWRRIIAQGWVPKCSQIPAAVRLSTALIPAWNTVFICFPGAVIKIPWTKSTSEGDVYAVSQFEDTVHPGCKSWWEELEVASHIFSKIRKQKKRKTELSLPRLCSLQKPSLGIGATVSQGGSCWQSNANQEFPNGHA